MPEIDALIGLEAQEKVLHSCVEHGDPALLIGPTGTGKTSLSRQVARKLGRGIVRVNLDGNISTTELIGHPELRRSGRVSETKFELGLIPNVMLRGEVLILDEINSALADVLFVIHALLESPPRLYIPEIEKEFIPKEGFAVVATMNPSHEYAGTKTLNKALYSRFRAVLRFEQLRGERLLSALAKHSPKSTAQDITRVATILETLFQLKQEDKISTVISIREGISALHFSQNSLSLDEAIQYAIVNKLEEYEQKIFYGFHKKIGLLSDKLKGLTIDQILVRAHNCEEAVKEMKGLLTELESLNDLRTILKGYKVRTTEKKE